MALAQNELEEIIVTADFRERAASDVPTSMTILDAETIEQTAVQHFEELIASVPNLNWSGDGHRARYLQIRGVGELAQYQGAPNPSVGFIVDDIDFSGIGSIATLFDIEQVEVLRGPQGTRYGANAIAGLIYVKSAEPGEDIDGRFRLGAGDDNEFSIGAAVGGPLGTGGFRFSAQHYTSDGFRSNPYLGRGDTNGRDELLLRGKVSWQAGNDWNFKATAMYADIDNGYDAFAIDNSLTVLSDNPGSDAQESIGASLRATWQGHESFELVSITSFANSNIDFSFDADWGNADAWAPVTYDYFSYNDRQRRTISQEIRLASNDAGRLFGGSTDWLLGAYMNRMDEDLFTANLGDYFDPGFNFADMLDDQLTSQFEALNTAIFGQLDITIGEAGVLSFGLRVESRATDYTDTNGLALSPDETMLGGELSYRHTFAPDLAGYVSLSRGYKAGGFNLGFVPDGEREFSAEGLWNAEAGVKSTLADGRLRINTSVFYYLRDDQQVETSMQLIPNDPASFVFFTDNAAEGEAFGLEADVVWLPADNVELYASIGLLHAEFENFVTPFVDLRGRDQAHAPPYTLAAGGIVHFSDELFARIDVSAKDEFYFDVSHDQKSAAYALTNLRLGYATERWTAQFYVRNLFDEHYAVRGFYFGNEPPDFPPELYIRQGDPRQIGVIFDMRY
jgi:outer membrane receptor protein involved in Fe transport